MKEPSPVTTQKEWVMEAIRHRDPARIPYTIYVEDGLAQRLDTHFGGRGGWWRYDNCTVRVLWPLEYRQLGEGSYLDPFGVKWLRSGGADCFVDPPVREPDPRQIPEIDLLPTEEIERTRHICEENANRFVFYQFTMTFGERLWCLRGLETYLMDLALHPEFVHDALDVLLEMHMRALDALLTLPVDGITFGDDFGSQRGMMISPVAFRTFFKPRLAKLYERVRRAGKVVGAHSCGDNTPIMRDFIEMGLQVFHPLQPEAMDIVAIKREYGKDLTFRGGIGVQGRLVHGKPRDAAAEVVEATRILSQGGGDLIEPCKPLPSETPIQNAIAAMEAMDRASNHQFDLSWLE